MVRLSHLLRRFRRHIYQGVTLKRRAIPVDAAVLVLHLADRYRGAALGEARNDGAHRQRIPGRRLLLFGGGLLFGGLLFGGLLFGGGLLLGGGLLIMGFGCAVYHYGGPAPRRTMHAARLCGCYLWNEQDEDGGDHSCHSEFGAHVRPPVGVSG